MPHIIVKLWPGKSEQQKTRLAEAITKNVMDILQYGRESVSVAMEEVQAQDWVARVYKPDIKEKWNEVYKKPGYDEKDL
jgi:4-oxalocrotonate tautomerase